MDNKKIPILVLVLIGVLYAVAIGVGFFRDSKGSASPKSNKGSRVDSFVDSFSAAIADRTRIKTDDLHVVEGPPNFLEKRTFNLPLSKSGIVNVIGSKDAGPVRTLELSVEGLQVVNATWTPKRDDSVPIDGDPPPATATITSGKPLRIAVMKAGGTLTLTATGGAGSPPRATILIH